MKKTTILALIAAISAGVTITSCKDDFTEKDVLNEQQTIDLSVLAYDPNAGAGIPNATVIVTREGKMDSTTTNANGVAVFPDTKIGSNVPVTVKASGFTTVKSLENLDVENFRQSAVTVTSHLFALTGPSTAVVKGKVYIETDLTNEDREFAQGTVITATASNDNAEMSVSSTVDAEGNYTLTLPTTKGGMYYDLHVADIEVDQKIAINQKVSEEGYPVTTPSIQNIKTLFSKSGNPAYIPNVAPIFITVTGGTTPATYRLYYYYVEKGAIDKTTYYLNSMEQGSGFTPGTIASSNVVVTSLLGETTKATATANADANGRITSITVTEGGAGYPESSQTNQVSQQYSSFSNSVVIESGQIRNMDFSYGTGTHRAIEVE